MAAAVASASAGNTTTADAVAGAHAHGKKGKGKSSFADVLSSILSASAAQTQTQAQAATAQDNIPKQKHAAFAQVKDALNASTAADDDTTDDSADATSALAAKIAGLTNTNAATPADTSANDAGTAQTTAATAQAAQKAGGKHGGKHAALTLASQAKLVSALTQAANAPAKIVGSDGKTAASSDSNGTPAITDAQNAQPQPAQSETPAAVANVLAAMQAQQPVVTTVAVNADKTEATVTPRTMTQLEKAAMGNSAQHTLHSAAPAAKTEAQALNMPADSKSANAKDGNEGQGGTDQKPPQNSDAARLAASAAKTPDSQTQQMTVPDAPQPATNPAPIAQTATNTAVTNAAATIGNAANAPAGTTPPTTIATTLQVAQQTTATPTTAPDLAALAVSIATKSKDGQNEFNIRMDPAELGRVDVRISVDAAGKAQAHLTADKPQTLQILQRDSQTLANQLKDSGLDLANNGLNFSLKGEQQNSTPTFIARNRALSINSVQTTDTVSSTSSTSTAPGDSRLDIRV